MAIPLIVNGVTFQYPVQGDKNWGPTLTNWSSAVTSGMLQKSAGAFTLTAALDFGALFGMKVLSITSEEVNPSATGFLRLANASTGLGWRNAANSGDLLLTVNASNQLTFNGSNIGATTSLTNGHILVGNVSNQPADVAMSGDITITNAGVTALGAGKVLDANIGSAAAIALTKLAASTGFSWYVSNVSGVITPTLVTASRAVVTDANGLPAASATTATQIGYLSTATSDVQTQIGTKLTKSGDTMSGVLNMASNKITSLPTATNSGDAVPFQQLTVASAAQGVTSGDLSFTSSTPTIITGCTVTVTPKSTASRFKLSFSGLIWGDGNTASVQVGLYRAGSLIRLIYVAPIAYTTRTSCAGLFIDSPATASAVTYDVRLSITGGFTAHINDGTGSALVVEEYYS